MKIGLTGAQGLIGWHVRCRLSVEQGMDVQYADRSTFTSPERLNEFVSSSDVIVHLAGMNRGNDLDIEKTNINLATALIDALIRTKSNSHILYSSSTHIDRDTPYGRSKRVAGEKFSAWAARADGAFTNLVLPHVFGECGKPFYNSVVSTFCYQLATGVEPTIDVDGDLELLHAQEVAEQVICAIDNKAYGEIRPRGRCITVSELLVLLRQMAAEYAEGIIPAFKKNMDLELFNTYRSYLYPDYYPVNLTVHEDSRGSLFEAVKTNHGGQAFVSTTKPGVLRGNHFHFRKVERFLVMNGEAKISLRRLFSDQVTEYRVTGDNPCFVDIPTLHTHNIENTGTGELWTFFWSNEVYNPDAPDTYPLAVEATND